MKNATPYKFHETALATLFILGNGVIIFPTAIADEYTFLAYLLCSAAAFLLFFSFGGLINRVYSFAPNGNTKPYKKVLITILYFVSAAIALYYLVKTFYDFSLFVSEVALRGFPIVVCFLVFLAMVVFFLLSRNEAFFKFSVIAFCFTAAVIVFFFLASLKNYRIGNIFIFSLPPIKTFIPQISEYFKGLILPVLLFLCFKSVVFKEVPENYTFWGILSGVVLLGFCILNSVLLFGTRFSATLDYPYASAVSTVTIGRLFTRLDGFSYFVYFAAAVVRINVCTILIKSLFKKIQFLFKSN